MPPTRSYLARRSKTTSTVGHKSADGRIGLFRRTSACVASGSIFQPGFSPTTPESRMRRSTHSPSIQRPRALRYRQSCPPAGGRGFSHMPSPQANDVPPRQARPRKKPTLPSALPLPPSHSSKLDVSDGGIRSRSTCLGRIWDPGTIRQSAPTSRPGRLHHRPDRRVDEKTNRRPTPRRKDDARAGEVVSFLSLGGVNELHAEPQTAESRCPGEKRGDPRFALHSPPQRELFRVLRRLVTRGSIPGPPKTLQHRSLIANLHRTLHSHDFAQRNTL